MFLFLIEEFHLRLGKVISGATISIGGEQKKAKIINQINSTTLDAGIPGGTCQGTEDASKWNECLPPELFAILHLVFWDDKVREFLDLAKASVKC